mmetsp:Transcript_81262/g.209168  ORF Transcript_81262/g.209168 Transcript_81262/m.209168 type:complete len:214 (-) Transcript_81262:87-728(-)
MVAWLCFTSRKRCAIWVALSALRKTCTLWTQPLYSISPGMPGLPTERLFVRMLSRPAADTLLASLPSMYSLRSCPSNTCAMQCAWLISASVAWACSTPHTPNWMCEPPRHVQWSPPLPACPSVRSHWRAPDQCGVPGVCSMITVKGRVPKALPGISVSHRQLPSDSKSAALSSFFVQSMRQAVPSLSVMHNWPAAVFLKGVELPLQLQWPSCA